MIFIFFLLGWKKRRIFKINNRIGLISTAMNFVSSFFWWDFFAAAKITSSVQAALTKNIVPFVFFSRQKTAHPLPAPIKNIFCFFLNNNNFKIKKKLK